MPKDQRYIINFILIKQVGFIKFAVFDVLIKCDPFDIMMLKGLWGFGRGSSSLVFVSIIKKFKMFVYCFFWIQVTVITCFNSYFE